jgi:hypothetical protein
MNDLSQIGVVVVLLLDSQQHLGVPLIQARDAIVVFHSISEAVDVLLFEMFNEHLARRKVLETVILLHALISP